MKLAWSAKGVNALKKREFRFRGKDTRGRIYAGPRGNPRRKQRKRGTRRAIFIAQTKGRGGKKLGEDTEG